MQRDLRPWRKRNLVIASALALALAGRAAAVPSSSWCEPAKATGEALERFELATELCGGDAACISRQGAELDRLRQRFVDDYFVARADHDFVRQHATTAVRDERRAIYVGRAEQRPRDAAAWSLAGRLQPDFESARPFFERSLALDAHFPWAHLSLAGVHLAADPAKSREHLLAFTALCPAAIAEVANFRKAIQDPADWNRIAAAARTALASARLTRKSLASYRSLWAVEFRSLPPAEFESAKARVRQDLARFEKKPRPRDPAYFQALEEGAKLLGDEEAAGRALAARLRLTPCSAETAKQRLREGWQSPAPGEAEQLVGRTLRARKQYEDAVTWTKECPWLPQYRMLRLEAALERGDLPVETLLTEIDEALALRRTLEGPGAASGFLPAGRAASFYVEQGVRLDQVAALAEEVREQADQELEYYAGLGLPAEFKARMQQNRDVQVWSAEMQAAKAALALARHDEVRARLMKLDAAAAAAPAVDDSPYAAASRREQLRGILTLKADLAAAEHRDLDHLAFSLNAAELSAKPAEVDPKVRETWSRLGGTSEGWEALTRKPVPSQQAAAASDEEDGVGWRTLERPLPPFKLVDLAGRTWTEADLKGKRTLINFWATWCVPCQLEVPHLEQLASDLKGNADVQILTLNMDQNPGIVPSFVAAKKMKLPTLLGGDYVAQAFGSFSIPRNWIVDAGGIVRFEHSGFSPDRVKQWVEETRALLETGKRKGGA